MEKYSRYCIHLSYDGTSFNGWQTQQNAVSIQQTIEKSISTLLRTDISIVGAGRTDTGVHASSYYAHFDCNINFTTEQLQDLTYHTNKLLPNTIAIFKIFKVNNDFHARFSAISRTYIYQITRKKNPFIRNYAWYYAGLIDINLMNEASKVLFLHNDFTSFCKKDTQVNNKLCTVYFAEWTEKNDLIKFEIKANRFLRNMVRSIVGTMIDIGRGKCTIEELHSIIISKNRCEAGYSAPAHGLFLKNIEYPVDLDL